jgi:hypothetical protein
MEICSISVSHHILKRYSWEKVCDAVVKPEYLSPIRKSQDLTGFCHEVSGLMDIQFFARFSPHG